MMLGDSSSTLLGSSSGDTKAAPAAAATIGGAASGGGGGGSNNSASEEDNKLGRDDNGGDRSFGGSRWLRQETLDLLNIRSDMDQVFRDSSLKGPLWEEVSRKLAELGYNRSAKKCKEKFENVYKYHKRTKDGLTGKPEGKHYKFFDQLQALDHHHHHHHQQPKAQAPSMQAITQAIPWTMNPPSSVPHINVTVTSLSSATPINAVPQNSTLVTTPPTNPTVSAAPPLVQPSNILSSSSTSSSTASEEYSESRQEASAGTRKRKWKMLFKRLTKQVIKKQEELQDKFLMEIERRERERIVREEAWRVQEISRINREHEILIQERSTAAAKDAAVIAFLQKVLGQEQQQTPVKENPQQQPAPPQQASVVMSSSSSRWPKAEVEALIKFKTDLANKYQENGPKGPLWEEISAAMRSIGYNRNAKRCKEKWENINKYFKKVKESNKKRPEDSKTCPYFDQLDALYKDKSIKSSEINVKAVNRNMEPLMVQPEQQWPQNYQLPPSNADQIQEDDDEDEGESEEDYEEDQDGNGGYEIVPKKAAAAAASTE